ncbi:hypothetical protein A3L11_09530 [Thermococcus siculi]|uniref:Uncharacterized protein n=1 Tax=Thermococcus siculi TaxID=72803 RepID=A0A2Z2MUI1_9EURY|nr:hypothetical protein [Thermococcus siculi]ASJ09456.1 hypothetical protein A3L11_09530 [Thermococcus siculi]
MKVKEAIMRVFPEIPELEKVDFSQYSTPYLAVLAAFAEGGKNGLMEFEEFVISQGGNKADVGRFLISVFQYLLIRYRRFDDESVEVPAFKLFLTLKGWLNENGFENDYRRILHSFVGYIVDIAEKIAERSDCDMGIAYMKTAYLLTLEAGETFEEEYFGELMEKAGEMLKALYEKCGIEEELPKKREKGC